MPLPTLQQIEKWDDNRLTKVYTLLFLENINPRLHETQEEVDNYLSAVNSEMLLRNLKPSNV